MVVLCEHVMWGACVDGVWIVMCVCVDVLARVWMCVMVVCVCVCVVGNSMSCLVVGMCGDGCGCVGRSVEVCDGGCGVCGVWGGGGGGGGG